MTRSLGLVVLAIVPLSASPGPGPIRVTGLTAAPAVARAYHAILDADFTGLPDHLDTTCREVPAEVCRTLRALALSWEITIEPESRLRDVAFSRTVDEAIDGTEAWTVREPGRAEAWFYLGAAYGARVQWRVLRRDRLAAAREGKQIKESLERALAIDPDLHDAKFGLGLYRYYADVAPSALRFLRWLLLLPGGDRDEGLRQILEARARGMLVGGEAEYQLHLIYLWYEKRTADALSLIRGLQARYPHNPHFYQLEAEIADTYLHDPSSSLAASSRLLSLAEAGRVHQTGLASVRARLNLALQLARLGHTPRARDLLHELVAERPTRPHGATARAQALLTSINERTER